MYPLPILLADRQVIDFRTDVLFRVLVRQVVRGVSLGLNLLNLGPQPAQHLLAVIRECGIPGIDGAGRVSTVALLIRETPCPETGGEGSAQRDPGTIPARSLHVNSP